MQISQTQGEKEIPFINVRDPRDDEGPFRMVNAGERLPSKKGLYLCRLKHRYSGKFYDAGLFFFEKGKFYTTKVHSRLIARALSEIEWRETVEAKESE